MKQLNWDLAKKCLLDVRLWILVLFVVRLENINLPPLDVHAFRQCLTLGVARCYLEWDWNLFAPRTILCDSRPGYEVMEFPVLNYAIFLLWKVFGEQNWCFRLLGLVVSSFGLWHFYKIILRMVGERAALAGTVLFGTSIAFMYARKAMPDVFSLSLVLIGVSLGWDYLEKGSRRWLIWGTVALALGLLSKIPSAVAVTFLLVPMLDKSIDLRRKGWLMVGGAAALAAMSAWYFVWIPWAEKEYSHTWFFRLGYEKAWHELFEEALIYTKERFYPIALQSKAAFWVCVFGLVGCVWERRYQWLLMAVMYSGIFLYFMLQVGKVFSAHEYYVIPYAPLMALLAGFGLNHLIRNDWLFAAALGLLALDAVRDKKEDFFIPWQDQKFLKMEQITNSVAKPGEMVLVITHGQYLPTMLYMAHRRGWAEANFPRASDPKWLDGEATVGMCYALVDRTKLLDSLPYPMLYEDNDFRIYKIKKD